MGIRSRIRDLICRLKHDGYSEVVFYDVQEKCYTIACTKCGRRSYIGAGKLLPTKFKYDMDTNPGAINSVSNAQLGLLAKMGER